VELEEGAVAQSAFETFQMQPSANLLSSGCGNEKSNCMAALSSAENH
jgi:hypothetical protein